MSKPKLSALISAVCLMGVVLYAIVSFSQSPQPSVQLTTNPPINQILPFEAEATTPQSPVLLKLQATDAVGKPLENAKISLTIVAPSNNPLFTTDFPVVEGKKLLEIEALASKGELQIQQMLPIRGTYQLLVNVIPLKANAFDPIEQKLTLSIPENEIKYLNFGALAATLLVVGLVGGLVIGGQQQIQSGEIAPTRVRLLLSGLIVVAIAVLLFVNISAEIAQSHMSMPMSHMTEPVAEANKSGMARSQDLEVQLLGDRDATVGVPANLELQLIDTKTNLPTTNAIFDVKTTQLENNWVAFAYQSSPDEQGKLRWQQQFFDGAPHKIDVKVSPKPNSAQQFQPFQVSREIEIAGVAPPLIVRSISLAYFTAIVAIGVVIGLRLKRDRTLQTG